MREGSALLERLEKRFESIDNRADRRSVGMRQRDSFLSHFSERMKELQNLVQVPEMSAFRRLPKVGRSFDPWGNIGGWSVLQDLVYLDWLEEQEIEEEEVEQPRVSAWGTVQPSAERRKSAWLNTPYTPARVAGKPSPKPQTREGSRRAKRPVKRQRTPIGGLPSKTRSAKAPTLSPLKRAMGRATIAQERRSTNARVMNSLPPMLAKTTGQRWVQSNQKTASASASRSRSQSVQSTLRSPMFKVVAQEMKADGVDAALSQSALASQRLTMPTKTSLLNSDIEQDSKRLTPGATRGLRTSTNVPIGMSKVSTGAGSSMDSELTRIVRRQIVRTIETNVPSQVSKSVSKIIQTKPTREASFTKEVVEVIEDIILTEAQSQIEDIFKSASIGSLDQLVESTGTTQAAVRRVQTIVRNVIKQLVQQSQQNGLVENIIQRQSGAAPGESQQENTLTVEQKKTIVQRLQSKGIRRKRAESILESIAASQQDVRYSVDGLLNQVLESVESSDGALLSKKVLERQVRRQLSPILSQSAPTKSISRSIIPTVVGENLSERVIADVVNEIASFADRETLVENSEGQRQLINSLERTVSKLVTRTRKPQMPDVDWVDVQAYNQDVATDELDAQTDSTSVSPWFTREQPEQSSKDAGSLHPMQQAAARVLKMVSTNPTRPEVIARQTGLNVQEVQQIVDSIQGFKEPTVVNRTRVSDALRLVSDKSMRPETIARQTGLAVQDVEQLVSRFQNDSPHPLDQLWNRATSPIALPEWTGMGTSSFKPTIGESAKAWRLNPKRRAVHPYAVDVDSTVLQPSVSNPDEDAMDAGSSDASRTSPWFSRKDDQDSVGFGFVPQTISGDAKLSSNEIAMFGGQAKSVQLSVGDVQGRKAQWLEPNRTVVLDNGTVIHAKMAKRLGLDVKASSKESLPLSWTLEGLQLKSDHDSLPTWAKRASGKPQVKASTEFLVALARASSAEDVAEVILQNAGRSQDAILPKTAMTAIDQIRREAHRSLTDMANMQQEMAEQSTVRSGPRRDRTRRRVSRTASAVSDGLTGLRPISTASPSSSGAAAGTDKVNKLTKQLESLVSMAESNRRDEAREGVRMAEESHDAIAEGQAASKGEERDYAVDIEALRQEVMRAFEQEMSIRSLRSFENPNNTDPWW